jgi:uncharacterized membrane protein YphA (DoxX/SURF4 family)
MRTVFLLARVVFGAWLLASGLNHFFLAMWPEPAGTQPLAIQLMTALNDSQLIDVTYGIQLVAGALILSGLFVPFALCAAMPVSVGAAFWTVILEHQPLGAALGLLAVALNALLMFAYLEYYQGVLQRHSLSYGESQGGAR